MNDLENQEQYLDEALNNGEISNHEYHEQMRELHQDYRAQAEEAAQEAYDREMNCW